MLHPSTLPGRRPEARMELSWNKPEQTSFLSVATFGSKGEEAFQELAGGVNYLYGRPGNHLRCSRSSSPSVPATGVLGHVTNMPSRSQTVHDTNQNARLHDRHARWHYRHGRLCHRYARWHQACAESYYRHARLPHRHARLHDRCVRCVTDMVCHITDTGGCIKDALGCIRSVRHITCIYNML